MLTLKIVDTVEKFCIYVLDTQNNEIFSCGWHGGEFKHAGKTFAVYGPYHNLDGDKFRIYQLVPVTEPK